MRRQLGNWAIRALALFCVVGACVAVVMAGPKEMEEEVEVEVLSATVEIQKVDVTWKPYKKDAIDIRNENIRDTISEKNKAQASWDSRAVKFLDSERGDLAREDGTQQDSEEEDVHVQFDVAVVKLVTAEPLRLNGSMAMPDVRHFLKSHRSHRQLLYGTPFFFCVRTVKVLTFLLCKVPWRYVAPSKT